MGAEVAPWIDSRERGFRPGKSGPTSAAQSEDELLLVDVVELDELDELDDSELDDELEDDDSVEDEPDDDP